MHRFIMVSLLWAISVTGIVSQNLFRVMFYNVENLFDTKDDSLKNDNDFLPDGFMRWTPWKYWEKLRNITRVITAVGGMQSPALIGLCEVENDSVIFDADHPCGHRSMPTLSPTHPTIAASTWHCFTSDINSGCWKVGSMK